MISAVQVSMNSEDSLKGTNGRCLMENHYGSFIVPGVPVAVAHACWAWAVGLLQTPIFHRVKAK